MNLRWLSAQLEMKVKPGCVPTRLAPCLSLSSLVLTSRNYNKDILARGRTFALGLFSNNNFLGFLLQHYTMFASHETNAGFLLLFTKYSNTTFPPTVSDGHTCRFDNGRNANKRQKRHKRQKRTMNVPHD